VVLPACLQPPIEEPQSVLGNDAGTPRLPSTFDASALPPKDIARVDMRDLT
jgi:hypothetical protein